MITLETTRFSGGKTREVTATIKSGQWDCNDARFLDVLRAAALPSGHYYPDRDLALVQLIQSHYGGTITDSREPGAAPKDAVY